MKCQKSSSKGRAKYTTDQKASPSSSGFQHILEPQKTSTKSNHPDDNQMLICLESKQ